MNLVGVCHGLTLAGLLVTLCGFAFRFATMIRFVDCVYFGLTLLFVWFFISVVWSALFNFGFVWLVWVVWVCLGYLFCLWLDLIIVLFAEGLRVW